MNQRKAKQLRREAKTIARRLGQRNLWRRFPGPIDRWVSGWRFWYRYMKRSYRRQRRAG